MQIKDYDFIKDIDVLFERKIIIYGVGTYGIRTAQLLEDAGMGFECFCDRNEEIMQCLGHSVITLGELQVKANNEDCMIVLGSTKYREEMIEELSTRDILAYVCTWYGVQAGIELHIEDQRFPEWFRQDSIYKRKVRNLYKTIARLSLTEKTWYDPVFVYVPTKVGGSSIRETLKKTEIEVIHLHTLLSNTGYEVLDETRAYLRKRIQVRGMKIITLVRDPIARVLSQFMQSFQEVAIMNRIRSHNLEAETKRWMADVLGSNKEFLWFDIEIKEVTGVDIYQYPFDKDRGYAWIKEGDIEILLLKTEMLSKNASIIGEFVGKPITELVNNNIGSEKIYKYIYEELKKRIRIPAELVVSQYKDNKYVDHFYTEEEKEQFRRKWSRNVSEAE